MNGRVSEADLDARQAERPFALSPQHDTLRRYPRTLDEAFPDTMAWWTNAEAAAADEEHIRAQFNGEQDADREPCGVVWAHRIVGLVLVGMVLALCMGWLR